MIWPFKTKPQPLRKFVIADPVTTARTLKQQMAEQLPQGRAHVVIALWHTKLNMIAYGGLAKEQGHSEFDIRHMMGMLEDNMRRATDEIARRRVGWFFIAGTLYYLCHFGGEPQQEVRDYLADIFIMLADATDVIPSIVAHNAIWKDNEKEPFKDRILGTKMDVLCNITPLYLRTYSKVEVLRTTEWFSVRPHALTIMS